MTRESSWLNAGPGRATSAPVRPWQIRGKLHIPYGGWLLLFHYFHNRLTDTILFLAPAQALCLCSEATGWLARELQASHQGGVGHKGSAISCPLEHFWHREEGVSLAQLGPAGLGLGSLCSLGAGGKRTEAKGEREGGVHCPQWSHHSFGSPPPPALPPHARPEDQPEQWSSNCAPWNPGVPQNMGEQDGLSRSPQPSQP